MHIYMRSNAVDARLKHARADEKRDDPRRKRNDEGDEKMAGAEAQERQEEESETSRREFFLTRVKGLDDGITPISDAHVYALMKGGRGGPAGKVARRLAGGSRGGKRAGCTSGVTWKSGGQNERENDASCDSMFVRREEHISISRFNFPR